MDVACRFWSKVDIREEDECWEWKAGVCGNGYGGFKLGGEQLGAHRVSWELHYGPIESGLSVLHKCDNPKCVNPSHLFLGTQDDNVKDRDEKGRHNASRGEIHWNCSLTEGDVKKIRDLAAGGMCQRRIAEAYSISYEQASKIILRKRWRHVE